jgi:broad specificity phosphatase PhoE
MLRALEVGCIMSSDQRRAHETALIIAEAVGVEVTTTPALRERSFGIMEGRSQGSMNLADIGIVDGCIADIEVAMPGGESLSDVYGRVGQWAAGALTPRPAGAVVVVAHGGSIRMLRAYLNQLPLIGLPWGEVANGAVIDATPRRPLLSASPH